MNILINFKKLIVKNNLAIPIILVLSMSSCFIYAENYSRQISIKSDKKIITLNVEIANNDESRAKGLMYRKGLPENNGMLFCFDKIDYVNFWMKNTSIPLSIAYINDKGVIMEIFDMNPFEERITYPSNYKVKYALEVNMGWFSKNGIKPGNMIKEELCNACK